MKRQVYGSDPYAYDFEAALGKPSPPHTYKNTLELRRLDGRTEPLAPPSHEALAKHARRFGRDCVAETALEYGLTASAAELAESIGSRQRRTSDELRAQVAALRQRGVVPAGIADVLNISDSRVRKLLAQAA
jgi:hypothetical protein